MQTAVEWFFRWVNDNPEATHKEYAEAFEQAKKMEKQQMEISDEEIYKASIDYDNLATYETPIGHFIAGCKWYREQLKIKQ